MTLRVRNRIIGGNVAYSIFCDSCDWEISMLAEHVEVDTFVEMLESLLNAHSTDCKLAAATRRAKNERAKK